MAGITLDGKGGRKVAFSRRATSVSGLERAGLRGSPWMKITPVKGSEAGAKKSGGSGRPLKSWYEVGERSQTQRHAKQIPPDALGRALRQVIGPRAQRRDDLHAWPKFPHGDADRQLSPCHFATGGADQAMQLVLGHHRRHGRHLCHRMPLGLDGVHHFHRVDRHQGPALPLIPGLPARPTPTGLAARPFRARLKRIARRRARRGARVLLQVLLQPLNDRFQALDSTLGLELWPAPCPCERAFLFWHTSSTERPMSLWYKRLPATRQGMGS